MLFFFFQAEDGIRDRDVTGVQTCALPIFGPIVADNRGAYLEIEGHTDSTGSTSYNRRLGEDRALAVRDYLHDHYQIALNRMAVISYGAAKPVEDNKTRANRAMNRRVVISVLERRC